MSDRRRRTLLAAPLALTGRSGNDVMPLAVTMQPMTPGGATPMPIPAFLRSRSSANMASVPDVCASFPAAEERVWVSHTETIRNMISMPTSPMVTPTMTSTRVKPGEDRRCWKSCLMFRSIDVGHERVMAIIPTSVGAVFQQTVTSIRLVAGVIRDLLAGGNRTGQTNFSGAGVIDLSRPTSRPGRRDHPPRSQQRRTWTTT